MDAPLTRQDPQDALRDHYSRLVARDRELRESRGLEGPHLHMVAWDAGRLAGLAFALGHAAEVRGWLQSAAEAARVALSRDPWVSGRLAVSYLAVAAAVDDAALVGAVGRARMPDTGSADRARALDAACAGALAAAAAGRHEEAEGHLRVARPLLNGDARSDDARLLAAVVASDADGARRALAGRERRRAADAEGSVTLDLFGLGVIAMARRQGLDLVPAGPAVPSDLLPAVAPAPARGPAMPVLSPTAAEGTVPAPAPAHHGLQAQGAEAPAAQRIR